MQLLLVTGLTGEEYAATAPGRAAPPLGFGPRPLRRRHSRWIADLVRACGHEVIVANAPMVQLIYRRKSKTDRSDALLLARLGPAKDQSGESDPQKRITKAG